MEINSKIQKLRSECESMFYTLSEHLDKDTAELLAPIVVGLNLKSKKEVYDLGLTACNMIDKNANECENSLGLNYTDGVRLVLNARRKIYSENIEDIDNSLELLKLF